MAILQFKDNYSNVITNPCNKDATKWPNWYYTWITIPLQELLQRIKHTLSTSSILKVPFRGASSTYKNYRSYHEFN